MLKILIAYIPVLHDGHRKWFEQHKDARVIYIWGRDIVMEVDYLEKEIRALDPQLIKKSLTGWDLFQKVFVLDKDNIKQVEDFTGEIIVPDDDASHIFVDNHLKDKKVTFENIFLRWERRNSIRVNKIANDQIIAGDDFSRKIIALAEEESGKSSDWWRHVGAVIIKEGKILSCGHNQHVPTENTPYIDGDPRNCFHKGVNLELSTSIHIEARLIAEAARDGVSLTDAEIYVTTFPCPPCAKMIAYSGIKKIYYKEGYGVLDGESILKSKGVEIYQVQ